MRFGRLAAGAFFYGFDNVIPSIYLRKNRLSSNRRFIKSFAIKTNKKRAKFYSICHVLCNKDFYFLLNINLVKHLFQQKYFHQIEVISLISQFQYTPYFDIHLLSLHLAFFPKDSIAQLNLHDDG